MSGHWVNKDASAWAKNYFTENLTIISASKDGHTAKVNSVLDVEGDVDVSQRKGKVITLFDVKIRLEFEGTLRCFFSRFFLNCSRFVFYQLGSNVLWLKNR